MYTPIMQKDRFELLSIHPFERLRILLSEHKPKGEIVELELGAPRHPMPDFTLDVLFEHASLLSEYPQNDGDRNLLKSITCWISKRYKVSLETNRIMALNGSREGLYNVLTAISSDRHEKKILIPNPFYQAYFAAALSILAEPVFVSADAESNFLPDYHNLSPNILNQVEALYLCSPSNPQGAVASFEYIAELLRLAELYDFLVLADECYSEIYYDTPPVGCLEVANTINSDPERLLIFNSLSKRSNLPGLRSGFVAGGIDNIRRIRQLRAFAGSPLPGVLQAVSAKAWLDENHVSHSRDLYIKKLNLAKEIFEDIDIFVPPQAGPFLWIKVEDGENTTLHLWQQYGIKVLPGAYLAQDIDGENPGKKYIRVAMVAEVNQLSNAFECIRNYLISS